MHFNDFNPKNLKGNLWFKPRFIILLHTKPHFVCLYYLGCITFSKEIYHENQSNFLLVFSTCSWHTSQMATGNVLWCVSFSRLLVYSTLLVFSLFMNHLQTERQFETRGMSHITYTLNPFPVIKLGFPCVRISTLLSSQGSCFHYRDIPACSLFYPLLDCSVCLKRLANLNMIIFCYNSLLSNPSHNQQYDF